MTDKKESAPTPPVKYRKPPEFYRPMDVKLRVEAKSIRGNCAMNSPCLSVDHPGKKRGSNRKTKMTIPILQKQVEQRRNRTFSSYSFCAKTFLTTVEVELASIIPDVVDF